MQVKDLKPEESHEFYKRYINKLPQNLSLEEGLPSATSGALNFFKSIPEDKLNYRYAVGKWTIKELIQHIIDAERVFFYRAFRIARHDKTPLEGFDENQYVSPSHASSKSLEVLFEEFRVCRENIILLYKGLKEQNLNFIGEANGSAISARAIFFIILGHAQWHLDIIKERYLD